MEKKDLELLFLVLNENLSTADAVICLEGDGQERTVKALEIFNGKWAPIIVVSGGFNNPPFSIIADEMAQYLISKRVSPEKIIIEAKSKNTKEQSVEVMKIVKKNGWKKIILVASDFHQARAYLTFLKSMNNMGLKIVIINAPVKKTIDKNLLKEEFNKIEKYRKKGHILAYSKFLKYQLWKEKNLKK